jgi:hypothetical protein
MLYPIELQSHSQFYNFGAVRFEAPNRPEPVKKLLQK